MLVHMAVFYRTPIWHAIAIGSIKTASYENLINNITLRERFNHLRFYCILQAQVFPSKPGKTDTQ